jgi:hypothetical protein
LFAELNFAQTIQLFVSSKGAPRATAFKVTIVHLAIICEPPGQASSVITVYWTCIFGDTLDISKGGGVTPFGNPSRV